MPIARLKCGRRSNGIILRRLFTEGALVHAGQPLYEIDPQPYRAGLCRRPPPI